MTPEQAQVYNAAIRDALNQYPNGKGAIQSLTKRFCVTVEHVGTTTKQEVSVIDEN